MNLLENILPENVTGANGGRKRKGLRLWRAEVLNWGTLGENVVHAADLRGDWLCITGRNGTGKSTLADAIITAFPPARMRIHYNAAGGAKNKKERTTLTYLRGYYGHEQDQTGKAKPSALRNQPGTLTAILLQFHEEGTARWVTLLVLGTFTASEEEQWLYGIIEQKADLEIVKGKEDWEARAKRLRKMGWHLTADPGPYRERLRTALRIPSDKAISTFVRTVGLKDIGDVNEFIRTSMLSDVSVHERYVDLTKHYQKQLEIDAEIESTRAMIEVLNPLAILVPGHRALVEQLNRRPELENAARWRINADKTTVLERLSAQEREHILAYAGKVTAAKDEVKRIEGELERLTESEPAKRAAALTAETRRLVGLRREVEARLNQLRGALSVIGLKMPNDATSFAELRTKLEQLVKEADSNDEERGDALATAKEAVRRLQVQRSELQREIDEMERSNSHLPADDLMRRAEIAQAVGLRPADLPFIGELVDVDPAHKEWRVALEKLLRTYARRILVPADKFGEVAAYVNKTDFVNARIRLERVQPRTMRFTMSEPDPRRAYAKLKIKPNTRFADWLHNALTTQYDHVCFTSVKDYERHQGAAITLEGLLKGKADYHEKRDDIRIRSARDYFLGWDNEEKVRSLKAERAELDERLTEAARAVESCRNDKETVKQRRDLAFEINTQVTEFRQIDLGAVNREMAELEKQRQQLAHTDPDAAKVEKQLAELAEAKAEQQQRAEEAGTKKGHHEKELENLTGTLKEIDDWEAEATKPSDDSLSAVAQFFTVEIPGLAKQLERWGQAVEKRVSDHFEGIKDERHKAALEIKGVMTTFISKFANERKSLVAELDAVDSFLEHLRYLEDDRLADLQERFRKNLEDNLALHVTQLKSELESQVGESERRLKEINRILDLIPWEGQQVIHILPRANPLIEIRQFKDLLADASAPLLAPTTEQKLSAFAAVKELIAFLADENVRKMVLDARHWQLFAVELRDLSVEDVTKQRRLYIENTDGLSGGQKNKLSVTLLASALAFQYDIAGTRATPGTFRTVIIDEAFARLDSENARYALELFKKFDFQLVLVHPLDGTVRIAEEYVQGFLLATIRDDRYSTLTSVRIEEFKRMVEEAEAVETADRRKPR